MRRCHLGLIVTASLALASCYTNPVTGRKSLVLLSQGEADRMGVVYASRAGYDPRASITF